MVRSSSRMPSFSLTPFSLYSFFKLFCLISSVAFCNSIFKSESYEVYFYFMDAGKGNKSFNEVLSIYELLEKMIQKISLKELNSEKIFKVL